MKWLLNLYKAIPENERRLIRDGIVMAVSGLLYAIGANEAGVIPESFSLGELTVPVAAPIGIAALYLWRNFRSGTPGLRS